MTGIDVYSLPPDEGEAVLRRQLAAAYRLVDYFGWTELIYGHLTARVPGEQPHFLINPFGLNYDEVTASNLVKIDLDGNIIGKSGYPVNYAGFVIHSAVHMAHAARHRVVMHTHTRAGMAVCALKEGLLPISMVATAFHGKLAYHDYEGPSLDLDERGRLLGEPRRQAGDDAAQPRPADHRPHRARGVHPALSPGARLPDPGRCGGGRHAQHHGRQSRRQVGRRHRRLLRAGHRPAAISSSPR